MKIRDIIDIIETKKDKIVEIERFKTIHYRFYGDGYDWDSQENKDKHGDMVLKYEEWLDTDLNIKTVINNNYNTYSSKDIMYGESYTHKPSFDINKPMY